jgi:hypothetical protein
MSLAMLFGWPAVLASILVAAVGIMVKRAFVVLVGAALAMPFLFYLTGTPRFGLSAPVIAVLYLGAVYAVARLRRWIAWVLWLVFLAFAVWIAASVLFQ